MSIITDILHGSAACVERNVLRLVADGNVRVPVLRYGSCTLPSEPAVVITRAPKAWQVGVKRSCSMPDEPPISNVSAAFQPAALKRTAHTVKKVSATAATSIIDKTETGGGFRGRHSDRHSPPTTECHHAIAGFPSLDAGVDRQTAGNLGPECPVRPAEGG